VSAELDLTALWAEVNAALREGDINRTLWEAAATAKPLGLEDDTIVLGIANDKFHLASYLETRVNKNTILGLLQAKAGRRLDYRIIEGDTPERYEHERERRKIMQRQIAADARERMTARTDTAGWERLSEQVVARYAEVRLRRLPQGLARFLLDVLPMVSEADLRMRAEQPQAVHHHERELGRILDKLASYTGVPATVIGLELIRYRERQARNT